MGKFTKHVSGETRIINGEEFTFLPLSVDFLPSFLRIAKALSGLVKEGEEGKDIPIDQALEKMDDVCMKDIKDVIGATMEASYPEEDLKERERFGLKYMGTLMDVIFSLNSDKVGMEKMKKTRETKLAEVKARMKNANTP